MLLRVIRNASTMAVALFAASAIDCKAGSPNEGCGSVTSTPSGIHVGDCPGGTISLSNITYDAKHVKDSYDFLVVCDGQSIRGKWSRNGGVTCLDSDSDPCKSGGVCTPKSAEDCRNIANCKEWGDCGYEDGKCVPTDEGCAASTVSCGLSGACHLGPDGKCAVTSNADCQTPFSNCQQCEFKGPCATYGSCYADNGQCIAKDAADCRRSSQCSFAGLCSLGMNTCVAASDSDCTSSEVCRTSGQCRAVGGVCAVR